MVNDKIVNSLVFNLQSYAFHLSHPIFLVIISLPGGVFLIKNPLSAVVCSEFLLYRNLRVIPFQRTLLYIRFNYNEELMRLS